MSKEQQNPDVDAYIERQSNEFQITLRELRAIIREAAPHAEELISYRIPCFKQHYMLVGFGVTNRDCSFYTMSPLLVESMRDALSRVNYSGTTLHFPPGEKLPKTLIKKIVKARIKENIARKTASGR